MWKQGGRIMHQMDLTEGVIWKKLILYAGPVVLSSLLQSAYSITDLIVAGWFIGKDGISAINNASQVMMILTQIIMGITTGGNILMGQYFGSKDRSNRVKTNRTMFGFALSAGALLSVLLFLLSRPILAALRAPALEEATAYLQVCSAGLIAIFGYNALAAMLRSVGNSKQPFYCVAVTAGCNIALDCLFMGGFRWGVRGAALACLVSRAFACIAVLFLLQKPGCMLRIEGLAALRPNGRLIQRILRVGIPAGIENGMFQIGKLSVASLTSTLGTAAIAANAVANTTSTFLNIPASAVGLAVLTVVGQCLGAGEKEQAVWYARRLLLLAYAGAWIMNLSAFFFADKLALTLFHLSPEAQAMALQVMRWFNIFSIFFWPSSFTLPNILRAAGDASFTMSVSIVSMWVFRVGFCYLMVLCFHGQLLSIWMGMFLDWVFRSVCFMVRFVRGKWLEQHVI